MRRTPSRVLMAFAAAIVVTASTVSVAGAAPQNGFKTKQPAMLAAGPDAPLGTEIKPIITVGDTIGGYRYEAIPDGISWMQSGRNEATVFVNHETSTVPFPYPVDCPQRLRQRTGEPPCHPQRWRHSRRVDDHPEQRRLPPLLLGVPWHDRGRLQPAHPVQ